MITDAQKQIYEEIGGSTKSNWKDWKWQVKHCIRSVEKFERLLDIKLPDKLRKQFEEITKKFPMSITPYYSFSDGPG